MTHQTWVCLAYKIVVLAGSFDSLRTYWSSNFNWFCIFFKCFEVQNKKSEYEFRWPRRPPNQPFWPCWQKRFHYHNSSTHLDLAFSGHYWVQLTKNSTQKYPKFLSKKGTSIDDGSWFNYELLNHQVQCTAWRRCSCNLKGTILFW